MEDRYVSRQTAKRLWEKGEDQLLLQIVAPQQNINWNWSTIAEQLNAALALRIGSAAVTRNGKQCRQRWQNYLNPELQNNLPWLPEERALLFQEFKLFSHQWGYIGQRLCQRGFARRGENSIKNYFYATIKRCLKLINGHIQNHNKTIRKRKNEFNQSQQKYPYKKRLSLERQINEPNAVWVQVNEGMISSVASSDSGELKIMKQLNLDNINKIMVVTESRGGSEMVADRQELAVDVGALRDTLIDFFGDSASLTVEQTIGLSREVLEFSRRLRCKPRKTRRAQSFPGVSEINNSCLTEDLKQSLEKESDYPKEMEDVQFGSRSLQSDQQQKIFENEQYRPLFWVPQTPEGHRPSDHSSELISSIDHLDLRGSNYDRIGIGQSVELKQFHFRESLERSDCKDIDVQQMMDMDDSCSNMAQFSFLNSIREVNSGGYQIGVPSLELDEGFRTPGGVYSSLGPHKKIEHIGQGGAVLMGSNSPQFGRKYYSALSFERKDRGQQAGNLQRKSVESLQRSNTWGYLWSNGQDGECLSKLEENENESSLAVALKGPLNHDS